MAVIVTSVLVAVAACTEHRDPDRLDGRQEADLRKAVYAHDYAIGLIQRPGEIPHHAMMVPEIVNELFSKCPLATLECLLKIAEGGRFEDSRNAAAFVWAAGRGDVDGSLFFGIRGDYDEIDKRYGESQRTQWVRMVKRKIESLKKTKDGK